MLAKYQGLFCSLYSPIEGAKGAQEVERGHIWDKGPKMTTGVSQTTWDHAQHIKLGEEGSGEYLEGVCHPITILHDGVLLSEIN